MDHKVQFDDVDEFYSQLHRKCFINAGSKKSLTLKERNIHQTNVIEEMSNVVMHPKGI